MIVPITPMRPEECRPMPDAGLGALETAQGNLPLESVDISARITGLSAGVQVVQGFRNPFDVSLEATYVFPLPPRAAVTAFRMEADDRVIEGVLKEREQARADYDRALAEGRRAAIAEEDRPDVFTIRVGNILPREHVRVCLTLSQPLPYEDGAAEFRFPLVVAPRYIPGAPLAEPAAGDGVIPDTDAVPDASRITPPVLLPGFPNPVRLSLTAAVDAAGLGLREIRSSLHEVSREGDTINLRPGERLDRDFILRLGFDASASLVLVPDPVGGPAAPDASDLPGSPVMGDDRGEDRDDAGTFTLSVLPPTGPDTAPAPHDVVLLLDRSGSMSGWKMVAARRAAARIVDTLTSRDRFTVLAFDSTIERVFPDELVEATDRNRYRAVEHLSRLEARGGTEILAAMEEALRLLTAPDAVTPEPPAATPRDRVLVLVTDGQVGNEDQILERIATRLGGIRVHTVGIDRAVNAGFLGRLALFGMGRCELVESEERLDEAMEHIHRRIGSPLVTDLVVKPEGLDVVAGSLTHVGGLYPGVPLVVSGRYRGTPSGAMAVRGLTTDGAPWETRLTGQVVEDGAARHLWARAHVRELEDRYAAGDRSLEERIVGTSLRFGVLCRFTAFVAVDSRVAADGSPQHRVIQPVETPSGWDAPIAVPMAFTMAKMSSTHTAGTEALSAPPGGPWPPAPGGVLGSPADAGLPDASFGAAPPAAPQPPSPRRGFSVGARMPHPGRERVPVTDLAGVLPLLSEELVQLRAAESLPALDRRRYLADLASRLSVIDQMVGGLSELGDLAVELAEAEKATTDLDALWRRALDTLAAIVTASGGPIGSSGAGAPEPSRQDPGSGPTRRGFWRRA
ncbi:hypothetical protein Pth03_22250 [Planotetraspora thailandica]|uniref:Trypsin n=1 Tax=Planotetraspora thailandica TaxID=487172 RepID=A0A8J3V2J5_9ACTN|nr:VIT domain-containing protein [Planotetraspora thailandica]GII53836.1 hypothetical protein Pth03_22250 [Planotetraspora thailandica]